MTVKIKSINGLLILGLSACAGTKGSPPPVPDAAERPDAGPQNICTAIEMSYGDLPAASGTALLRPIDEQMPLGPKYLSLEIPLNADAKPDLLMLELWEEIDGPFSQGISAKKVSIISDQTDLIRCSACAFIAADVVPGEDLNFNMAYAGELELTNVDTTPDTGRVTGTLQDLKFREITVDAMGQHTVPDGCRSTLASLQFDFGIAAAPTP